MAATYLDLVKRVKSGILMVLESQALVFAPSVPIHNQARAEPATVAGCENISRGEPAFTQIHITMAMETGGSRIALIKKSFL